MVLSCNFSKTFYKNPSCHAHIWSKIVNAVNTTLYYGQKSRFHKKNQCSLAHILSKNFYSAYLSHSHILSKKRQFSQKRSFLMSCFSNITWKTTFTPIFGLQNVNSVKTAVYYEPKKSIGCPFFRFLTKKSLLSCLYFFKKTSIFSKIFCSHVHILLKNVHFLKNTVLPCHLFQIFHGKSLPVKPIFGQKTSFLSTLHYIMGQKSQYATSFFPNFCKKKLLSCPYFDKKRLFSKKHRHAHIL